MLCFVVTRLIDDVTGHVFHYEARRKLHERKSIEVAKNG